MVLNHAFCCMIVVTKNHCFAKPSTTNQIQSCSMKIRTITAFTPLTWPFDEGSVASLGRFLTDARLRLSESGFDVQNVCLATPPFLDVIGDAYQGYKASVQ